jgi:hypothetical protein
MEIRCERRPLKSSVEANYSVEEIIRTDSAVTSAAVALGVIGGSSNSSYR